MKITGVRLLRLTGTMPTDGPLWEERLVRPIDIYPEYRAATTSRAAARSTPTISVWNSTSSGSRPTKGRSASPVRCPTWWPPSWPAPAPDRPRPGPDRARAAVGSDAPHQVHGRQGDAMLAISAIDCALWDLKGKLARPAGASACSAARRATSVPAYASMLGFAVQDLGRVRERARGYQALGYPAQKWFFRHGPMSGHDGMRKNVDLVRTLRETLGDDYDIMLDCWQSIRSDLRGRARRAHRRVPAALARGMRHAGPHRQLPAR